MKLQQPQLQLQQLLKPQLQQQRQQQLQQQLQQQPQQQLQLQQPITHASSRSTMRTLSMIHIYSPDLLKPLLLNFHCHQTLLARPQW